MSSLNGPDTGQFAAMWADALGSAARQRDAIDARVHRDEDRVATVRAVADGTASRWVRLRRALGLDRPRPEGAR